jgi:hypothetical protein
MLGLGARLFDRTADLETAERITQSCYYAVRPACRRLSSIK